MLTIWIAVVNNRQLRISPRNNGRGEDTILPVPEPRPFQTAPDSISLAELRERLGNRDLTLVDVRALPAYNGWRLSGAARGSHIRGAVAFPIGRLDRVHSPEVE